MQLEKRITLVGKFATSLGYCSGDIDAAVLYFKRRFGIEVVPGRWQPDGCFQAAEETEVVRDSRSNTRQWQLQELEAAKTAKHCAQLTGSRPVHAKRIARTIQMAFDGERFLEPVARGILKAPMLDQARDNFELQ